MNDVKKQSEGALFRFGVIGDLVHLPPGAKGLYARLKEKAAIDYRIPGSTRVRVAEETIRHAVLSLGAPPPTGSRSAISRPRSSTPSSSWWTTSGA